MKVIMLGPSLEEKGGMGQVEKLILERIPTEFEMQHITTWDGEPSQRSKLHMLKVFARALWCFGGELWRDRVDVVHIHLAERGSTVRKSILALMAFAFRKPVIIHTHGCEFHLFYLTLPNPIKRAIAWLLQRSTYTIVLSESWKEFYVTHCGLKPEQTVVLLNPVAMPEHLLDRGEGDRQIDFIFLGKITPRKGIFEMLQAFAKLPSEQREKVNLILAGTGEIERARELAQELNIESQVSFPGWINGEQRNELLAKGDVFLLPSYNEGLPMALLEGMSWGLAPIVTPVGGIPEVVEDGETGLVVNPGDIEGLAQAMQKTIENEPLRSALGRAARSRVASLDIHYYIEKLVELYCGAVKSADEGSKPKRLGLNLSADEKSEKILSEGVLRSRR